MKHIIHYLLASIALLGFQACDSLFDNELPKHDLVGDNAIVDQKSAETALNGVYSYLDDSSYLGGDLTTNLITYNNIRLNFMVSRNPSSFERDQVYRMTYDETDTNFEGGWEMAYQIINAANNVIYYVEQLSDDKFAAGHKNEILAEARFIRAFANMYLMENYAQFWDTSSPYGLVLRLEPSALSNNTLARSTVDSSYNAIFADLDFAINYGPDFYSVFRACKTSAKAFKANWLMVRGTQADREEAIRLADEVLGSEEFAMEENYADIFRNKYTSTELLFTQYTDRAQGIMENVQGLFQKLGSGQYRPKEYTADDDLSRFFEIMDDPEEERYKATLDSIFLEEGSPQERIAWVKHYDSAETATMPMYYLRLAQMYLIKAEAMCYLDGYTTEDVATQLNVLRDRAHSTHVEASDYTSKDQMLEEIFREYVRELSSENGDVFFYAARTFINGERLLKSYNSYFTNDNQLCFPIPARELEINFLATQNPY